MLSFGYRIIRPVLTFKEWRMFASTFFWILSVTIRQDEHIKTWLFRPQRQSLTTRSSTLISYQFRSKMRRRRQFSDPFGVPVARSFSGSLRHCLTSACALRAKINKMNSQLFTFLLCRHRHDSPRPVVYAYPCHIVPSVKVAYTGCDAKVR